MEKIITITEWETLETKTMKKTEVGHMIGKIEAITEGIIEASVINRSMSGSKQRQIEIGLDVLNIDSDNHFARDYPMTQVDREVEQIPQMFNMDGDQTILQTPLLNVDQVRQSIGPIEARAKLNL